MGEVVGARGLRELPEHRRGDQRENSCRNGGPADCAETHAGAGCSVRTATSGGQLIRTGTYTVPRPRLTNIVVPRRRASPATTGNSCAATAPITGSTTWPPCVCPE